MVYDRHFPEGWRALGLAGRPDRVQPVGHQPRPVPTTCGGSSSPPRRWPTSTSSARSTGSASSRSATTTSTARPTSWTRAGSSSATPPPTTRTRCWCATWTWSSWPRSGTCGSSTGTAGPTSTSRWSSAMSTTLISGGTVVTVFGTLDADVLVAGQVSRPRSPGGRPPHLLPAGHGPRGGWRRGPKDSGEPAGGRGGPGHRRDRQVRAAGRDRRAHAHGDAVRRHLLGGYVRDRHPRRGVGRHHDDRRLRRPGQGHLAARRRWTSGTPRRTATARSTTAST